MSKTINVLVVCANGVATSTIALVAIREAFEEMDIPAKFGQGAAMDATRHVQNGNYDFIISTAGTNLDIASEIEIISGVPFLTGIGIEETYDKIKEIVAKKS